MTRGFCPRGLCPEGAYVLMELCMKDFLSMGVLSRIHLDAMFPSEASSMSGPS